MTFQSGVWFGAGLIVLFEAVTPPWKTKIYPISLGAIFILISVVL